MNKIRLVTVTGSRTDTLEYMLNHYYDLVDEIYVVAYDTNNGQHANVKAITDKFKQKVFLYKHEDDQEYNWETVTAIYNEIKSLYPNDWWVVSDDDEFHIYPKPIRDKWLQHLTGRYDHTPSLWAVLMFQSWLESSSQKVVH